MFRVRASCSKSLGFEGFLEINTMKVGIYRVLVERIVWVRTYGVQTYQYISGKLSSSGDEFGI